MALSCRVLISTIYSYIMYNNFPDVETLYLKKLMFGVWSHCKYIDTHDSQLIALQHTLSSKFGIGLSQLIGISHDVFFFKSKQQQ